ncbi:MAG: hypothetical protein MUF87_15685 [Anaerolineae bacterium]|jgi:DNA-directed RNA polymerase specialized sigma24 family protein|nr:hypothetical protein [Anaerolineae bacterium]
MKFYELLLENLSLQQQRIFVLKHEGYTFDQISSVLGCTLQTTLTHWQRIRVISHQLG